MSDTAVVASTPEQALPLPTSMVVLPWHDPVVEPLGFPIDCDYLELFWLPILGPTSAWLVRRLASGLDAFPDGYELDVAETAAALGLSVAQGLGSQFHKALQRCRMFGLMHDVRGGVAVRTVLPPLSARQLRRLPVHLQQAHEERHAQRLPS